MLPPVAPNGLQTGLDLVSRQRRRNHILTGAIGVTVLVTVTLVAIVVVVSSQEVSAGLIVAAVLVAVMAGNYTIFRWLALARLGQVDDPERQAALEQLVGSVAECFGMVPPEVRIVDNAANAIAFGSGGRAVVVFTTELLHLLSDDEEALEAVAAHELAHIANRDSWLGAASHAGTQWVGWVGVLLMWYAKTLHAVCSGYLTATGASRPNPIISSLRMGCWVTGTLVAPAIHRIGSVARLPAHLISLGLCRQREFAADATASSITGKPDALSRALSRLEGEATTLGRGRRLVQDQCIAGPHPPGALADLFNTHPNMARRIERLATDGAGTREFRTGLASLIVGLLAVVVLIGGIGVAVLRSSALPSYAAGTGKVRMPDADQEPGPAPASVTTSPGNILVPTPPPSSSPAESPTPLTPEPSPSDPGESAKPPTPQPTATESAKSPSPPTESIPARPSRVKVRAVSDSVIRVSWRDNSDNETGFTVNNGDTSRTAKAKSTSYDWRGMKPGTYMCFHVSAFNNAGTSRYAPTTDPFYVCTTTPESAPKAGAAPVLLGSVDFKAYCRSIGTDQAVQVDDTAYGWRCRTGGQDRPLSVTDACRSLYGTKSALDKIVNFDDPSSWQCWQVSRRLGAIRFDDYCRSQGANGAILVNDNAYGWRCQSSSGKESGISATDACRSRYAKPAAIDRMTDYSNPNSWECWT